MAKSVDISAFKDGLEEQGLEILEEVELAFFTVSPQTIVPFEEAELSWKVTGPEKALFFVELNGVRVAKTGKAVVHPLNTTTYRIEAVALTARKKLGTVTLVVNREDCLQDGISQNVIETFVTEKLQSLIEPGSKVELRGDPVAVRIDAGQIVIDLFLKMIINNFFDADLDLTLNFSVGVTTAGEIRTPLKGVDADAKFDFAEHIITVGVGALIQGVAQAIVAAMTEALLGPQLEEELAAKLQEGIETVCKGPVGPDFRITSIRAADGVLQFECCRLSEGTRFSDVLQSGAALA